MSTQTFLPPAQVPDDVLLGGRPFSVEWRQTDEGWQVSCVFPGAVGPLMGYGCTVPEAIRDLVLAHREFSDFNDESSTEWWRNTYV
jgi:hypothetical protein